MEPRIKKIIFSLPLLGCSILLGQLTQNQEKLFSDLLSHRHSPQKSEDALNNFLVSNPDLNATYKGKNLIARLINELTFQPELVAEMLEKGAKVNESIIKSLNDEIRYGGLHSSDRLRLQFAEPIAKHAETFGPFEDLVIKRLLEAALEKNRTDLITLFLEKGMSLPEDGSESIINELIKNKQLEALRIIAHKKLDEFKTGDPIFLAFEKGKPSYATLFIQAGSPINVQEPKTGETALIKAVKLNDKNLVKMLLKLGADLNVTDSSGRNALYYAAGNIKNILEGKAEQEESETQREELEKMRANYADLQRKLERERLEHEYTKRARYTPGQTKVPWFEILGVYPDATSDEINSAARRLLGAMAPDKAEEKRKAYAEKRFRKINNAKDEGLKIAQSAGR